MNTNYEYGTPGQTIETAIPTPPVGLVRRKRALELMLLANECVSWLEAKGLQKGEQCVFREMAERLWWAKP